MLPLRSGLWSLAAMVIGLLGGQSFGDEPRPNIVFILTDDLAPDAVGFAGHPQIRTPNIDRIAKEGAVLKNAFCVTPVCSPSRASIATSRYGSQLGILDWINPRIEPELGLDPDTVTWIERLQQGGYDTALIGKWHLGTAQRFHPTRQGYDYFAGFLDGGRPTRDPVFEVNGHDVKQSGFTADVTTDLALAYLATRRGQRTRPFAMSLHYREPHAPWLPAADEDRVPYEKLDVRTPEPSHPLLDRDRMSKITREYYASVASVDRNVGRILDALDAGMLAEKTIVIFTSDHGYNVGHHGLLHKGNAHWLLKEDPPQEFADIGRGIRPNLYDQSLRVPAAVRWPGKIAPGTVVQEFVTHLDWLPTLLSLAEVERPDGIRIYGRDASRLLRGEKVADWRTEFYVEYSMRHGARVDLRGWRTPEWKLVVDFAHPSLTELYHLKSDPLETENLASSTAAGDQEVQAELRKKIIDTMKAIGDPIAAEVKQGPAAAK